MSFSFRGLKPLLAGAGFVAAVTAGTPSKAEDYPVDCAILLCLAGGWPASEACTDAYSEFIDRITPWPVEPPLQIWRCPMGASFETDEDRAPMERLRKALSPSPAPLQSAPVEVFEAPNALAAKPAIFRRERGGAAERLPDDFVVRAADEFINEDGAADMDISGPAYDFVRSIRVYMIGGFQFGNDDNCNQLSSVRLGSYGSQGDYRWQGSELEEVPPAYRIPSAWGDSRCPPMRLRSVFVEWHDHAGAYGWERVDY